MDTPTIFAPVIIPTLCRYDHFKSCLESLMRCTWADKTDVYIGLDYPLKESHWDGYKKISEYLTKIENNHTFKSLNVIRRERNYGFGPNGNSANLREFVLSKYDYFIFSEDDNIFSPAFLDYINKGLEKFKDDPTVLAICGYRHFYDLKFENNTFYRQNVDFSAWGYGMWKKQYKLSEERFRHLSLFLSPRKSYRLYRNGLYRVYCHIWKSLGHIKSIDDNAYSVMMATEKLDVVMPRTTMVRNMGWDGSGEHCQNVGEELIQTISEQELFKENSFAFIGAGNEHYKQNNSVHVKENYDYMSPYSFIKALIKNSKRFFKR